MIDLAFDTLLMWGQHLRSGWAGGSQWLAGLPLSAEVWSFVAAQVLVLAAAALLLGRHRRKLRLDGAGSESAPRLEAAVARPVRAPVHRDPPDRIRGHVLAGLCVVILLAGGLGGWASISELAGAVLAQGTVVVDSNVRKVQHPSGGIVGDIRVRDGDKVKTGDLLVRLDETIARASLQVITKQLDELAMRQARLKAERDGSDSVPLPARFGDRQSEAAAKEIITGEYTLYQSRREARAGQKAQLRERISQFKEEIGGLTAQSQAKAKEIELIQKELAGQHELWSKNLLPITKYTQTQREVTRLEGERGQFVASIAQARGKISEIELQTIQIDQDLRSEVIKDLREVQAKEAELAERQVAAEDQLKRIDIRAPQNGIVHQLSVHTVGGVITQGEIIMLIVPDGDTLVIEARIAPQDIDHVGPAQAAFVRFPAFNQRTTPEFDAVVQRVSADLTREPQSNLAYYVVRLELPAAERARMGHLKLVPGMPAEVHIKTAERTALSYLVRPLQDQIARAFKEQ